MRDKQEVRGTVGRGPSEYPHKEERLGNFFFKQPINRKTIMDGEAQNNLTVMKIFMKIAEHTAPCKI
jgi:hypothetical protein